MSDNIKVGISNFPPLVISEGAKYRGFEIDIWEAIAQKNGYNFEYEEKEFQEIIPSLAGKKIDIGLAGITINEKREKMIDFSHATLGSGLLILVSKDRKKIRIFKSIKFFIQEGYKAIISPLWLVIGFILVFANVLWFAEKGAKTFSANYLIGIFESAWLVICSMSTDSFGDYVPHTWPGRFVVTLIIIGGVAIFGLFIAQISAFIAVKKIKGDISNYRDLHHKNVATVRESTSVVALKKIGAKIILVSTIQEAYEKLKNQEVEAVVFDAPVLLYFADSKGGEQFEIVGDLFDRQSYGVAFQNNSVLREKINQTILMLRESGYYDTIYKKWFGENLVMEL